MYVTPCSLKVGGIQVSGCPLSGIKQQTFIKNVIMSLAGMAQWLTRSLFDSWSGHLPGLGA